MATLTIRDLDESLKQQLRIRAAHSQRSMEEEVRQILRAVLTDAPAASTNLAERVRARFAGLGDVTLPVLAREPVRSPPSFEPARAARAARDARAKRR